MLLKIAYWGVMMYLMVDSLSDQMFVIRFRAWPFYTKASAFSKHNH